MLQLFQQYRETLQNLGYENIYKEKKIRNYLPPVICHWGADFQKQPFTDDFQNRCF